MHWGRALLTLVALVPMIEVAHGQPVDPYLQPEPAPRPSGTAPDRAPAPAPALPSTSGAPVAPNAAPDAPVDPYAPAPSSTTPDPVLVERVAASLVARAQELLDSRLYLDAKQLAVEALVRSPRGSSSEQARAIIHTVNRQLGIPEDAAKPELVKPTEDVDTSPIQDPTAPAPVIPPLVEGKAPSGRIAARVHGGLYAGLLGTTIGAFFSDSSPAKGAVPGGVALGLAGALVTPMLVDKLGWSEPEVRTIGAATLWGGAIGGLFGDVGKTEGSTAREVLVAASVGATLAGLGGYAYARSHKLTRGDVALVDTLAGVGAASGLAIGMLMQPAETEAYSLNSVLGIAGGVAAGLIAAPRTDTTPRRMLRVAGLAALGGGAPFLLYAGIKDKGSSADERVTGLLSTGGLVVGAYLGFRFTRGMDKGLDTLDGKRVREADDAPIALVGRSSAGRWGLGGIGLAPLSAKLAPQRGVALQLVGVRF